MIQDSTSSCHLNCHTNALLSVPRLTKDVSYSMHFKFKHSKCPEGHGEIHKLELNYVY